MGAFQWSWCEMGESRRWWCEMEIQKKTETTRKRERGGIMETRNLRRRRRRRNVLAPLRASRMTHSYLCPPQ